MSTSPQLQAAIASARPGDRITLASGSYSGPFDIFTTGTAAHPVVMLPAAGATVTLTATLPMPSCGASGPDDNRTIRISRGASHWVIQGLSIVGGVIVSSTGATASNHWITSRVDAHDWRSRRAVPGRGTNNPAAASGAAAYLSRLTRTTILPSDDIQLVRNTITKKGVFSRFGRYGVLDGNTVTNIACGTGPGIWLANYSDAWSITRNNVSAVATSTYSHFMQEGIRIGTASSYNHVYQNVVHDLPTQGRAITNDIDGSWNVYDHNTATNVDIGFNDQQSGWGNTWDHNTSSGARTAGFSFRMEDAPLSAPSYDTSTNGAKVSCNTSNGSPRAMQAGAMSNSVFRSNTFATVFINPRLRGYWGAEGDVWNGTANAPSDRPKTSSSGC